MTAEETIEWTYRLNEALGIGRNPKRAKDEANEWKQKVTEHGITKITDTIQPARQAEG